MPITVAYGNSWGSVGARRNTRRLERMEPDAADISATAVLITPTRAARRLGQRRTLRGLGPRRHLRHAGAGSSLVQFNRAESTRGGAARDNCRHGLYCAHAT